MRALPGTYLLNQSRTIHACMCAIEDAARERDPERWDAVLENIRALWHCHELTAFDLAGVLLYANQLQPGIADKYIPMNVVLERMA